jgi:hypothetical protein
MRGLPVVLALAGCATALAACSSDDSGAVGSLLGGNDVGSCVEEIAGAAGDSRPTSFRAVAREVERMRQLRFRKRPRPRYLPRRRMEQRIRSELEKYPAAELAAETRALVALGALPRGTNLKALIRRTVPGQIAGFYDPATGELVVGSNAGKGLDGIERLTLAHELEHALVDQVLRLPAFLEDKAVPDGLEDLELAGLSLIEGDATLLTEAFATKHLSLADAFRSIGPALAAEDDFEKLPYYLQASLIFPYEDGLTFVCSVFERGGWKAVNRAYKRPPRTSAEVLFPERYFARVRAADAPDPRAPGHGWDLLDVQAVGAAHLLWLFEAPGGDTQNELPEARERAKAWAGGKLHVYGRGGKTAVGLTLVQRRGERSLCASMRAWRKAAHRRGSVRCSGRVIRATLLP